MSASEERIAARVAELVMGELEARGMVYPIEKMALRLTTKQICALLGCSHVTLSLRWRDWGLRRIGRGARGIEYCAASVARYRARLNGGR